ncbi:NaeI family type II restriction endonuclease [Leisingera sp. SS27]|uniref:NaeI family type II restriction endonuclease n=1 Tax=Leisingera sp. SS27 TaxID=2979462 RepID=UPI00232EFDD6|nr:NaeI family type II restriction endonuclease [Leisingera sp. SS27]MDC0657323.1 NaeI family type II restriction endonuclease [Leisingera sp. SS27]
MKQKIPNSLVDFDHQDFNVLLHLEMEITQRAGGLLALEHGVAFMLRDCIDDVIMTPKTGRRSYEELEKTEKTYIGTRVEIELRALLGLRKGRLDTVILGHDVDIKHTMGSNWMIPTEAVGSACLLVAADEARARCYLGLIVARPEYLTAGQNKDAKRSISAEGFKHIQWLLKDHPYPANFWRTADADAVQDIFDCDTGNARMATLFRLMQRRPIPRAAVEAVAQQKDFMRRIRADGGHGTRDILGREQIVVLEGRKDAQLIKALELPPCAASEFISCRIETEYHARMAGQSGHPIAWPTS